MITKLKITATKNLSTKREISMPSQDQVHKTNLSALVRKKIRHDQKYVATITDIQRKTISIDFEKIMINFIQSDHPDINFSSPLRLSDTNIESNIKIEDLSENNFVALIVSENNWKIVDVISKETYVRIKNNLWNEQLLLESIPYKNAIRMANASQRLETFFKIPSHETTPFGICGKIEQGNIKISKKILHWCSQACTSKEDFDLILRKGLPQKNTIPSDGFHFSLIITEDNSENHTSQNNPSFHMIALLQDEYQELYSKWLDVIAHPPKKTLQNLEQISSINTAEIPSLYRNSIHDLEAFFPMSNEDSEENFTLRKTQYHDVPDALILEESSAFIEFPTKLQNLIEGLRLPLPTQPLSEGISTIIAWTQSDSEAIKNRTTDFLLMFLAEGKEIHQNTEVHQLWNKWHQTHDPIERLCLLICEGEEEAGIQALVGRLAPKPRLAKKITSYLIQRIYHRLQNQTQSIEQCTNLSQIVQKFHSLGIYISSNWIERWFLCFISAHHLNTPIVLSGSKEFAEIICRATQLIFNDISLETIKLSRRRGHLWGKNSKEHDIFELSPLSIAIRNTIQKNTNLEGTQKRPAIIFAEDISRHLKDDSLHSSLIIGYSDNGVSLYKEERNTQWLLEYQELSSKNGKDAIESQRLEHLKTLFDRERLGDKPQTQAWKLFCPKNMLFIGCLEDQDSIQTPEFLQHAFTLTLPDIDFTDAKNSVQKYQIQQLQGQTQPLHLDLPQISTQDSFSKHSGIRSLLTQTMTHLTQCDFLLTPQLIRQISMFSCIANSWNIIDEEDIFSHVMLSIILPRIYTSGQKLESILPLLIMDAPQTPSLQKRLLELQNISMHYGKNKIHGAMRWLG
jgi:hypothetical protein